MITFRERRNQVQVGVRATERNAPDSALRHLRSACSVQPSAAIRWGTGRRGRGRRGESTGHVLQGSVCSRPREVPMA